MSEEAVPGEVRLKQLPAQLATSMTRERSQRMSCSPNWSCRWLEANRDYPPPGGASDEGDGTERGRDRREAVVRDDDDSLLE